MKKILCMLLLAPTVYITAQTSETPETVVTQNGKKVTFFPNLEPAWYLGGNANGALKSIGTKDNFNLPFMTNNTERMTLTTGGFLGLNTTTPQSAFNIVNDNVGDGYDDLSIVSYGDNYSGAIFLNSAKNTKADPKAMDVNTVMGTIAFRGWNGTSYYDAYSGIRGYYMGTKNSDLRFYTSNTEKLRITDVGNVGIGRQDPTVKLDVYNQTAGAVKIVDGTQGAGKVLTSDANGLATWQSPVSASTFIAPQGTNLKLTYDTWNYSKRSLSLSKGRWIITLTDRSFGFAPGATYADMIAGWSSSASSYIPSTLFANGGHTCVSTQAVPSGNKYLNWNYTFVIDVTTPTTIYLFFNISSDVRTGNVSIYNGEGGLYSTAYGALIAQKVME
ncbi:hypothetical protein SAMN06265349_1062 [Flavobacterium resistens]|uniref:DUF4374 domain-containing protein n=1 Tax=Flavobacterium resistens TaxID=443612 RepID=A0A521EZ66_9FLAO|nr:hypothetical protein [Flavobacterium resistens]MRX69313.1 hypothetical protein [Flavobacterium resistens]SMO89195.1 hypothetical protein SAMN06265349_1062 [Flavobacterium resistens]